MEDLKFRQSLPLSEKIRFAKQAIKTFKDRYDFIYVSCSGGIDSEIVLFLTRQMYPNIPVVFALTGLEHPSVRKLAMLHDNLTIVKPQKGHLEVLTTYGYPVISKDISLYIWGARHAENPIIRQHYLNRFDGLDDDGNYSQFRQAYKKYKFMLNAPFEVSDKCCYFHKEKPCQDWERENDAHPITGIMASESQRRTNAWLETGCNAFDGNRPMCKPLSTWTKKDSLQFLYENEDIMMESLKKEAINKGYSEEWFYKEFHHPWADAYKDIVPIVSNTQLDGQIDLFNQLNIECDSYIDFKTTGCDRTGCIYCMYGAQCKGDMRFVTLKKQEPKLYNYVMRGGKFNENGMWVPHKGLGFKYVIDWMNEHGNLNIKY